MSDSHSPGFPPPASMPAPTRGPGRSAKLWLLLTGCLVVLLGVGGTVFALTSGGDDPTSVQDVAEAAVAAAEDLDVDAGLDLMCSFTSGDRSGLERAISEARDDAGTDSPDVRYEISDVVGSTSGTFVVTVVTDEPGLEGWTSRTAKLTVASRDGRSCISDVENIS